MALINRTAESQNGKSANNQSPRLSPDFDQAVVLRQSPRWSRAVVWAIVGVTSATVAWACLAKIEEAIPAQGQLEPQGVVQPVQAPVGGVIDRIHVEEGETVEAGELLVSFDPEATEAQRQSLQEIRQRLIQENQFYRAQLAGDTTTSRPDLPPEITQLTRNRSTLVAENELYRLQLQGVESGAPLTAEQRQRLNTSLEQLDSSLSVVALEADQLNQQLVQTRVQLANAREELQVNQEILDRITPLVEAGAVAQIPYLQQQQEVNNRQAQVNSLVEEAERLRYAIAQAQERLRNTLLQSREDLQTRIAENESAIATIDSQLNKTILENEKRLEEIEGQLTQLEQTRRYQQLRAPVSGTIFNLQANEEGYVVNSSDPVLDIVPNDTLVARVYITNRDIGFVKQQFDQQDQLSVDVRIDSYPFSEFGDIDGTLVHIGSDALPPNDTYSYFRFPAEIELSQQALTQEGYSLTLQSGMSVSANIKLRKRRVITILTDLFVRKIDSLKSGG